MHGYGNGNDYVLELYVTARRAQLIAVPRPAGHRIPYMYVAGAAALITTQQLSRSARGQTTPRINHEHSSMFAHKASLTPLCISKQSQPLLKLTTSLNLSLPGHYQTVSTAKLYSCLLRLSAAPSVLPHLHPLLTVLKAPDNDL